MGTNYSSNYFSILWKNIFNRFNIIWNVYKFRYMGIPVIYTYNSRMYKYN